MSEFADYVERQQAFRTFPGLTKSITTIDDWSGIKKAIPENHTELDIIDTLNLSDTSVQVRLKDLLLGTDDNLEDNLQPLSDLLLNRLLEGHGETLFDLGLEDNGESMMFNKEQWDIALNRLRRVAKSLKADCRILITRNVGGPEEADSVKEKETGVSGKMLIRQLPETIEDVIETRIAVVGNGTTNPTCVDSWEIFLNFMYSGCWQEYNARSTCEGRS